MTRNFFLVCRGGQANLIILSGIIRRILHLSVLQWEGEISCCSPLGLKKLIGCLHVVGTAFISLRGHHGGAKPPPKWVMKCPVFWLIFNNFVTFHHFFTKLGNLIWVFGPNNLT